MRFPVDADLLVCLYTVGQIVFSIPRLQRSAPKVPICYQIEKVPLGWLTEAQARYFAPYDTKLDAMNYLPVCTYRITNYGQGLLRQYVNHGETSRCVVMIYELALNVDGRHTFSNNCTMSFHTRFTDNSILTTRNMKLKSILDRPPYQIVQECPQISEPSEMKRIHDARAQTMGCPVAPLSDPASIIKDVQSEHERFSEYQLASGAYKPLPDGNSYAIADKAHWRAIRNYLNPFAQHVSIRRFFLPALVAAALPVFAFLWLAPATADAARNVGFSPVVAAEAVILACYLVAGAIIGYVLERQTFVWVFLLTYVAARLFAGASLGPVPYSAFAGSVAYSVAQAKKRRRAVLLPEAAPQN
jgi:hypothetical protein